MFGYPPPMVELYSIIDFNKALYSVTSLDSLRIISYAEVSGSWKLPAATDTFTKCEKYRIVLRQVMLTGDVVSRNVCTGYVYQKCENFRRKK